MTQSSNVFLPMRIIYANETLKCLKEGKVGFKKEGCIKVCAEYYCYSMPMSVKLYDKQKKNICEQIDLSYLQTSKNCKSIPNTANSEANLFISSSSSSSFPSYYLSNSTPSLFINDVVYNYSLKSSITPINTVVTDDLGLRKKYQNNTILPLCFKHNYTITIPKKVKVNIERHIPKKLLHAIHKDLEVAKEMCLWFISLIAPKCYFNEATVNNWVSLNAGYLRQTFSSSPMAYKKIIEALKYPLRTGAIIEHNDKYKVGKSCMAYKLGDAYLGKGLMSYKLTNQYVKELFDDNHLDAFKRNDTNPIVQNLLEFYKDCSFPSLLEAQKEAKIQVDKDYITKKGKYLKFKNKHSKNYYKNLEDIAFVEDGIELYKSLIANGLMVPKVCGEECGGRVVDTLTLMPSWIRKMVKFKGKELVELDYSCLHPNAAMSLYGGKKGYLTHAYVAVNSGIDIKQVKVEHLSFFNKKVCQMKASSLWEYYEKNEPEMLKRIVNEKYNNNYYPKAEKHKITSQRMFKKEVEIMTDVIRRLNKEGIYVGYVYDALLCTHDVKQRVKEVMDEVTICHCVKTTAKIAE